MDKQQPKIIRQVFLMESEEVILNSENDTIRVFVKEFNRMCVDFSTNEGVKIISCDIMPMGNILIGKIIYDENVIFTTTDSK